MDIERKKMLQELGGVLDRQIAEALVTGMDIEEIKLNLCQYNIGYDQCTCADCKDVVGCNYAWDPYNTNGSCLAGK